MNERQIWRPNSLTPEEWGNLSREQQITWWKDREGNREPSPAILPLRAVRLYHKGIITRAEFPSFVFGRITEDNVQEFLDGCPSIELQQLRDEANRLPATDDKEGWSQLISIESACYAPWVTDEEILQGQQERSRRFREGVQVFRTAIR